eukprot:gene26401-32385_t
MTPPSAVTAEVLSLALRPPRFPKGCLMRSLTCAPTSTSTCCASRAQCALWHWCTHVCGGWSTWCPTLGVAPWGAAGGCMARRGSIITMWYTLSTATLGC